MGPSHCQAKGCSVCGRCGPSHVERCSVVGMGCLIIASGIPVYCIFVLWKNKPKAFVRLFGGCLRCRDFKRTLSPYFRNSHHYKTSLDMAIVEIHAVVS